MSLYFRAGWINGGLPSNCSRITLLSHNNKCTPIFLQHTRLRSKRRVVCSSTALMWEVFLTLSFLAGVVRGKPQPLDQKIPPQDPLVAYQSYQSGQSSAPSDFVTGSSVPRLGTPSMPQSRVYHYVNPTDGNHITSLLPPDHPEMVCLQQGSHLETTKFGLLGEFFCFRTALLFFVCDKC